LCIKDLLKEDTRLLLWAFGFWMWEAFRVKGGFLMKGGFWLKGKGLLKGKSIAEGRFVEGNELLKRG
jgi:hypothetical protein